MPVRNLDVSDPASLEAALEAAPPDTLARVTTSAGEAVYATRCPGGWAVQGDLPVTSGDVADARPLTVALLLDPDDEYLPPEWAVADARAAFDRARATGDRAAVKNLTAELDDLAAVGWDEAAALLAEVEAWLR